jgi:hypothetical protein
MSRPLKLWDPEDGSLCFGILAPDDESVLISFVKKTARDWSVRTLSGVEAGSDSNALKVQKQPCKDCNSVLEIL